MKCLNPVWIKDEKILVPCNQCEMCKIARSKDWSARCIHERGYHQDSVFITLTYDDDNLPENGSICKKELQKFMKRFRKSIEPRKIKVYGCGEYGEEKNRPHYHLILFGVSEKDFILLPYKIHNKKSNIWENAYIHESWKKGIIHIGNVDYDSVRYVADYTLKNGGTYYGDMIKEIYGDKEQPFQIFSKGIGKQWCLDNEKYLRQKLGCTVNGREVGLNKYYRRKLDISGEEIYNENKLRCKNDKKTKEDDLEIMYNKLCFFEHHKQLDYREELQQIYNQRRINFKKSKEMRRKN